MLPEGVAGIRIRFHNPNEFANEFSIYRKEENFDEEVGRNIAHKNAREQVWQLEGYLLRDK